MDATRVDSILQYALLVAGEEDSAFERELGPIHFIKYVYLADLAFARANDGQTYTGASWIFYDFGPWAPEVYQRIEPAMAAIHATRRQTESHYEGKQDWIRWNLQDDYKLNGLKLRLPFEIRTELEKGIHAFKNDTRTLLDHVYKTAPMLSAAPQEALDFHLGTETVKAVTRSSTETSLTVRQQKKLREQAQLIRQKSVERKAHQAQRFVPRPPRYDSVYEQGLDWLEGLAGQPFVEQTLSVEFSADVWDSSVRKANDVP